MKVYYNVNTDYANLKSILNSVEDQELQLLLQNAENEGKALLCTKNGESGLWDCIWETKETVAALSDSDFIDGNLILVSSLRANLNLEPIEAVENLQKRPKCKLHCAYSTGGVPHCKVRCSWGKK